MNLKTVVLVMTIGLLLSACGASYKLKRAKKLIAQAKASGAKVKRDTTYVMTSLYVPGTHTTFANPLNYTLFKLKGKDTAIFKDRILIRFKDSLIYVQCPDSTIHARIPVAVNEEIQCPEQSDRWKWVALTLAVILMVSIVLHRV